MTVAVECPSTLVRLQAVPACEPPFDDGPAPRLRLVSPHREDPLPFDLPPADPAPAALWDDAGFDRQPTPRADLPDPRPWAGRLVLAVMETLSGRRPVQQLMAWTDDAVYAQVSRAVRRRQPGDAVPRRLASLRVSEPADGIAEICAVLSGGDRSRAVAARLEGADGRWRCTVLQLV